MSTTAFSPFLSCPPEIHDLILSSCSTNDQTCLRLTCKYFYNLSSTSKEALSLAYNDTEYLCEYSDKPLKQIPGMRHFNYMHRRECHDICYAEAIKRADREGRPLPRTRRKCLTRRWSLHCECFVGKTRLHQRLRTWLPRGLNYCGRCNKFTKRKLQHKGRCYHGLPKRRKPQNNFWTYRSHRGGFGGWRVKMWMKWFNSQSMNRLERRLASQGSERSVARSNSRYELRTLKPKLVDTRMMRY